MEDEFEQPQVIARRRRRPIAPKPRMCGAFSPAPEGVLLPITSTRRVANMFSGIPPARLAVARMGTNQAGSCFFHALAACRDYGGYISAFPGDASASYDAACHRADVVASLRAQLAKEYTRAEHDAIVASCVYPVLARKDDDDGSDSDGDERAPLSHEDIRDALADVHACANEAMIRWAAKATETSIIMFDVMAPTTASAYCSLRDVSRQRRARTHPRLPVHYEAKDAHAVALMAWLCHDHFEPLAVALKNEEGETRGGASPHTALDWKVGLYRGRDDELIAAARTALNAQCR